MTKEKNILSEKTITVRASTYAVFRKLKALGLTENEMQAIIKMVEGITTATN